MPQIPPSKLKEFAQRLLDYEAVPDKPAGAKGLRPFRVFEKLREPLGKVTGAGGFRLILARSLAQAGAEVPWLRALHVKSDGSLEGLEEMNGNLDPAEIAKGEVALAVEFIGLLVTFIGPTLTLQLLQDIWPKMDELEL